MKHDNHSRVVLCIRWVVDAGLEPRVNEGMQRGGRRFKTHATGQTFAPKAQNKSSLFLHSVLAS
jgi:hypothetical protein